MPAKDGIRILLDSAFDSFEELSDLVEAWELRVNQLSKDQSRTMLTQLRANDLLISDFECGCFSTHTGVSPEDSYNITIPSAESSDFHLNGRFFDRTTATIFSPASEFSVHARPGYRTKNFTISAEVVDEYCHGQLGVDPGHALARLPVGINFQTVAIVELNLWAEVFRVLGRAESAVSGYSDLVSHVQTRLLDSVFRTDSQNTPASHNEKRAFSRVVRRAIERIDASDNEFLSVADLASSVCVSDRTLQRAFKKTFGIGPKQYLFGHRMHGTHRELWRADPSDIRVVDVAHAWGFWQLGQFAKDYRKMFGELPSETLRKATRSSPI